MGLPPSRVKRVGNGQLPADCSQTIQHPRDRYSLLCRIIVQRVKRIGPGLSTIPPWVQLKVGLEIKPPLDANPTSMIPTARWLLVSATPTYSRHSPLSTTPHCA